MATIVDLVIPARRRDIGGLEVGRVLPYRLRRTVGPFIFFDQMGPVEPAPGPEADIRPHPHIGLATVTYLLDGAVRHRDSLGVVQTIRPGDVNWMQAGRGIVHSERFADPAPRLAGIQAWVALPRALEQEDPFFLHHPVATLPMMRRDGVTLRLLAGSGFGTAAPAAPPSPLFYAHAELADGAELTLDDEYEERGVYVVRGAAVIDGGRHEAGTMAVLAPNGRIPIRAAGATTLMLLGGAPLDGRRFIWWNFVASDEALIERAKADWKAGRFTPIPHETDPLPLPE